MNDLFFEDKNLLEYFLKIFSKICNGWFDNYVTLKILFCYPNHLSSYDPVINENKQFYSFIF